MLLKIADGTIADITEASIVRLVDDVFGVGSTGPFPVDGFEGSLPLVLIAEEKLVPVDPALISGVDNPDVESEEVVLSDGKVIVVDRRVAPVLKALIEMNQQLERRLADVFSGDAVKKALEERDVAFSERDAAMKRIEKLASTLDGFEQGLRAMKEAFGG